ncbi:MAG: RidA family protein [Candidatus Promineifilaceae bacterium]|nr:RidA family protein [Candidatus Promineifilaceae bacterium]
MIKEFGNPDELFNSVQYGFSQAVAAGGSRIISISGQVAWNADEELIGGGDLYLETVKALENLQIALRSVGAELKHVIALRIYIVGYKREDSAAISRALNAFFVAGQAPTATWIGVNCLANPDFRIEIEATAVA